MAPKYLRFASLLAVVAKLAGVGWVTFGSPIAAAEAVVASIALGAVIALFSRRLSWPDFPEICILSSVGGAVALRVAELVGAAWFMGANPLAVHFPFVFYCEPLMSIACAALVIAASATQPSRAFIVAWVMVLAALLALPLNIS